MIRYQHHGGKLVLRYMLCGQIVSVHLLVDYIQRRLLAERGARPMHRKLIVVPDDAAASMKLAGIDYALRTAALATTSESADIVGLGEEIIRLKQQRTRARQAAGVEPVEVLVERGTLPRATRRLPCARSALSDT